MTLFLSKFFAEKSLGSAVLAFGARYQLLEKSLRILDAQKRALHSLLLKRQLSFKDFCCGSSIFVAHFGCTHKQRPSASRRVGETVSRHEKTSQHCRGFGGTAFCSAAEPTNSLALIDFAADTRPVRYSDAELSIHNAGESCFSHPFAGRCWIAFTHLSAPKQLSELILSFRDTCFGGLSEIFFRLPMVRIEYCLVRILRG